MKNIEQITIEPPIKAQSMGEKTSKVFAGEGVSKSSREAYGETPKFFAEEIRKRLSSGEYSIADIGSFRGELLQQLVSQLPEYQFRTIAVDINQEALNDNFAQIKVVADAKELPFGNKSNDISIMRYLLQWNIWEYQKNIIKEIIRTTKEFVLIEHVGSDNQDPEMWRERVDELYDGRIPKLKRTGCYFSSREEIEQWMKEEGILFERIQEKIVENVSEILSERFGLDERESAEAKEILGNKNFSVKTDWIIFSK